MSEHSETRRSLRTALELMRVRRQLRHLQRRYYNAPAKDEAVIVQGFQTLARARRLAAAPYQGHRLHLGCGEHLLEGWVNVDASWSAAADLRSDLSRPLPFRDASIDLIHSEDLLEHLDLRGGGTLLSECFRILRPGGVMRLLTPDLRRLIWHVYLHPRARHLAWCHAQLEADGPCEALNMHCRMGGEHRFIYDFAFLKAILTGLGFRVRRVRWNRSRRVELRYLDLRDFGLNLFLEATKPWGA